METNWNQLIERYLQNELSDEGKNAFEQELQINPELREELELHQLIQSAAKRASQRSIIQQTGKWYVRNLRIKQVTAGIVITAIAVAGMVYWIHTKNKEKEQLSENIARNYPREKINEIGCRAYQLNHQSNQTGGKSSLIQPTDWQASAEFDSVQVNAHLTVLKVGHATNHKKTDRMVQSQWSASHKDSTPYIKPTEMVLGYTNDRLEGKGAETPIVNSSLSKNTMWMLKYDSIGKFNDLYCGYALVMNKSKFGFVDPDGKVFIPLIYDQLVVTTNIKSSKQKNKRQRKKVLYIPKRSGKDVKDCEEAAVKGRVEYEVIKEPKK